MTATLIVPQAQAFAYGDFAQNLLGWRDWFAELNTAGKIMAGKINHSPLSAVVV